MRGATKARLLFALLPALLFACAADEASQEQPGIEGPALVMWYTDNWVPWEEMMPIVNGLEEEFAGALNVVRLDATESANTALQEQYGLRGHPSFVVLDRDGGVVERYFGSQREATLRTAVEMAVGGE